MATDDHRRAIGSVVAVSADKFVIEMRGGTDSFTVVGFDDLHYVARLGSFVIIPAQAEYVVAEIVGLREKDAGSGGDLDKAASAKFLDVVPVGMLPIEGGRFRFGVSVFPSLYADALYASTLRSSRSVVRFWRSSRGPKRWSSSCAALRPSQALSASVRICVFDVPGVAVSASSFADRSSGR